MNTRFQFYAHYWLPARWGRNTYPKWVTTQEQNWGTVQSANFTDGKCSLRKLFNSSGRWGDQAEPISSVHRDPFLCPVAAPQAKGGLACAIAGTPQLSSPTCWPATHTKVQPQPVLVHLATGKAPRQRCCMAATPLVPSDEHDCCDSRVFPV